MIRRRGAVTTAVPLGPSGVPVLGVAGSGGLLLHGPQFGTKGAHTRPHLGHIHPCFSVTSAAPAGRGLRGRRPLAS